MDGRRSLSKTYRDAVISGGQQSIRTFFSHAPPSSSDDAIYPDKKSEGTPKQKEACRRGILTRSNARIQEAVSTSEPQTASEVVNSSDIVERQSSETKSREAVISGGVESTKESPMQSTSLESQRDKGRRKWKKANQAAVCTHLPKSVSREQASSREQKKKYQDELTFLEYKKKAQEALHAERYSSNAEAMKTFRDVKASGKVQQGQRCAKKKEIKHSFKELFTLHALSPITYKDSCNALRMRAKEGANLLDLRAGFAPQSNPQRPWRVNLVHVSSKLHNQDTTRGSGYSASDLASALVKYLDPWRPYMQFRNAKRILKEYVAPGTKLRSSFVASVLRKARRKILGVASETVKLFPVLEEVLREKGYAAETGYWDARQMRSVAKELAKKGEHVPDIPENAEYISSFFVSPPSARPSKLKEVYSADACHMTHSYPGTLFLLFGYTANNNCQLISAGFQLAGESERTWTEFFRFVTRQFPEIDDGSSTIIIDGDKGARAAHKSVFTNAGRFLCSNHRAETVAKKLGKTGKALYLEAVDSSEQTALDEKLRMLRRAFDEKKLRSCIFKKPLREQFLLTCAQRRQARVRMFGKNTTQLVESLNQASKTARCNHFLEGVLNLLVTERERLHKQRKELKKSRKAKRTLTPSAMAIIDELEEKAAEWPAHVRHRDDGIVEVKLNVKVRRVNLQTMDCSCGRPTVHNQPCLHVYHAAIENKDDITSLFNAQWSVRQWKKQIPSKCIFDIPTVPELRQRLQYISENRYDNLRLPALTPPRRGRPKKQKRFLSRVEVAVNKSEYACGACGRKGHNRRTCNQNSNNGVKANKARRQATKTTIGEGDRAIASNKLQAANKKLTSGRTHYPEKTKKREKGNLECEKNTSYKIQKASESKKGTCNWARAKNNIIQTSDDKLSTSSVQNVGNMRKRGRGNAESGNYTFPKSQKTSESTVQRKTRTNEKTDDFSTSAHRINSNDEVSAVPTCTINEISSESRGRRRKRTSSQESQPSSKKHRCKTVQSMLPNDRRLNYDDYALLLTVLNDKKSSNDTICRIGPNRCFFTRSSAWRFLPGRWFNDELINTYLGYLNEISPSHTQFFPCFFSNVLKRYGHTKNDIHTKEDIHKWDRRFCLTDLKRMVFPVASNGHWFCVSIDIDERRITQYDSYNVSLRRSFVYSLCRWLSDKSARDNGESNRIATDQWELCVDYVPEQTNTFDCGPITACVCRSLALGLPFDFKEEDMPYKRCEIALSMLRYTCRH